MGRKKWRTKEQANEYQRNYYKKNREKYLKYFKIYRETYQRKSRREYGKAASDKRQELRLKLKEGKSCVKCGYKEHSEILHFHHHNGNKKSTVANACTEKAIIEEAAKCILICPNCHAVEHIKRHHRDWENE